ncbi:endonuclease/exonuclease/phosphatase family protein [Patiriisocius marinus]|nr:endonuclease/exonuclease/phosphatase family protein [Patiriisocius marinus]
MKSFVLLFLGLCMSFNVSAQETIKTMFYNLLEFPEASPGGRGTILKNILDTYEPDIFMICEVQNQDGADIVLNESLNSEGLEYDAAQFIANGSGPAELQQLIYWKRDKFTLLNTEVLQTTVRDINHYTLQLNTADAAVDPVIIEAYVAHLKSSQGTANQNLRLSMVQEFTTSLETLDPNAFVLFAGDFNVYRATEVAYQEILDPTNNVVMVDPIDVSGTWNNESFQAVHTQSTRVSSGGFGAGAGGGMDDRFDFIMMSQNMQTNPKLRYVPDTYFAYGNNGNCYNNDVNSADCTGSFSQELRNNIYNMSDHLPVVMTLETNKEIVLDVTTNQTENELRLVRTIVNSRLDLKVPSHLFTSEILVFNTLGQKITTLELNNQSRQVFDISGIADGIYYLKTTQSSPQTLNFVKTH